MRSMGLLVATLCTIAACDAAAVEITPLLGFWQPVSVPCKMSDSFWIIDRNGASPYESKCTASKVSRKGSTYTLRQSCSTEGEMNTRIVKIKRISPKQIEIDGARYKRCPVPWN